MASILAGRDGQEKWRACVEFAGVTDHLHFLLKAVYAAVLFVEVLRQDEITRFPASERKTKMVVADVVQGERGIDAGLRSCLTERAACAHRAARQAEEHAGDGHVRGRRHEQHGSKHGGYGGPHVYDAATRKAARRHRESKSRGG